MQPFGRNAPTSKTERQDIQTDKGPIAQGEPFYKRSPQKQQESMLVTLQSWEGELKEAGLHMCSEI